MGDNKTPEKWDESQTEEYIPTLYDPIITAAYNDNDGKGVYFVARWKAVANGLLADGETRKDAVRALLDATSDWLGVFVATERKPAAAFPEPEGYQAVGIGCSHEGMLEVFVTERHCRAEWPENDVRPLYAEPTPNGETETARLKSDLECEKVEHAECCETVVRLDGECVESAAKIRALLEALEKIIAEVSERRVGHREKIVEIARTAIDQARGD